uniref:BTB domain-containing protein n=1 Tax=Panagrolaimus davidi TaxID=227884 RepID=A0A914Q852_9BILA
MKSMNYINRIHPQLEDAFKSQNPELFDIVFDFEGKKLYADKLILSINSSTFKSMLSDRWICKNDAIKIKTYKFDDFKELLTFFYSGECNLTNQNIFTILDMAEFYQIEDLKEICAEYLSKIELNLSNVIQHFEILTKYSMIEMKGPIQTFIFQNFKTIFKSDKFLNTEKSVVTEIIALGQTFAIKYEEMFQAAYEWSESEAIKKQKELNDKNFNMNDGIKVEMQDFLPFIPFNQIEISLFIKYVVKRSFIFTPFEFSDILESVQSNVKVFWETNCEKPYSVSFVYWRTNCRMPSTPPSPLKKRIGAKCYLFGFHDGDIGISTDPTDVYYLLAEMFPESDFEISDFCKIEFV